MGTTLPASATLGGMTALEARNALRAMKQAGRRLSFVSPLTRSKYGGVLNSQRARAAAVEEMAERGFIRIDGDDIELTEAGRGLAWSKSRRYPQAVARTQIERLLDRVAAHNADPKSLFFVDQVWLFGSVLRGEETVGDIDLAYSTTINPAYEGEEAYNVRRNELMGEMPDSLSYHDVVDWHLKRALCGPRRHPLLAGMQDGIRTLIDMAVPCQVLYDMAGGGKIASPVLAKHPEATIRKDHIFEPLQMPDLAAPSGQVGLSDYRWASSFRSNGAIDHEFLPRHAPGNAAFVSAETTVDRSRTGNLLDNVPAPDDRGSGAVLWQARSWDEPYAVRASFSRSLEHAGDQSVLVIRIDELDEFGETDDDVAATDGLGSVLAEIAVLDIRRILDRATDLGEGRTITLRLEASHLEDYAMHDVVADMRDKILYRNPLLTEDQVASLRIEEPAWEVDRSWEADGVDEGPAVRAP